MKKKIRFNTISIGSEPDQPGIDELAGFIGSHRGTEVDLIRFYLARSLAAQKEAQISSPCGGGMFCLPRLEVAFSFTSDEGQTESSDLMADASTMIMCSKHTKSALPAPHLVPGSPVPGDEEQYADFCDGFSAILRDMRDAGVTGHLLHARLVCPMEFERIASRKAGYIIPDGNEEVQGRLLEFQQTITLENSRTTLLSGLLDQYDIRSIIIINPDEAGLKIAMEHFDPDQISAGGYGTGQENGYWNNFSEKAEFSIDLG